MWSFLRMLGRLPRRNTMTLLTSAAVYSYSEEKSNGNPEKPSQPVSLPDPRDYLTHAFLIKQTYVSVVESQSLFLTRVTTAMQDASREYLEVLGEMTALTEDSVLVLTEAGAERLLELKLRSTDLRKTVNDQELLFHFIKKSVDASVEMCFLAGSEFASAAVAEKLRAAEVELNVMMEKTRLQELAVARAQVSHIDKVGRAVKIIEKQVSEGERNSEEKN